MDYSTCFKTLASIMGLVDVLYWIQAWYQHHHHHHHHHQISALCFTRMLGSFRRAMQGDRTRRCWYWCGCHVSKAATTTTKQIISNSSQAFHQNPTQRMDYSTCFKTLASIMGLVDVLYWIQAWYQHHHHHHHHHQISALCFTRMLGSFRRAMQGDRTRRCWYWCGCHVSKAATTTTKQIISNS